jgi:CheY-like chemotaxis protein/HPt (histidine-containing phosphotransfer) domain-containing protein
MADVLVMASQLNDSDSRADNRGFADTVLVSGEGLVGILNDTLESAKIEAGRLDLQSVDFDLRTLVEDVTDLLSVSTHDRGIELGCRFPLNMPATLRGDVDRLRRVVTDLVGNAVKSISSGDVLLELTVAEVDDERVTVRFEIVGTGAGVDGSDQQALFASFPLLDAAMIRSRAAAALSLAVTYELVSLMDGQIGLHRELDHGVCFWFAVTLARGWSVPSFVPQASRPDQRVLIVDERLSERPTARDAAGDSTSSGHVLIAEDNPVNQRVAAAMLENLGFRVDVAADGVEAVRAAMATSYQAILMDGQMPVLDGYQATNEIRRLQGAAQHTPIIAVTGSTMKSDQQRCLAAGMDDYLAKPLNLHDLRDVLTRWASAESDPNNNGDPSEPPPPIHVGLDHLSDPDRPVLDAAIIGRLERLGESTGDDLLGQLSTLFLSDAEVRVVALREAIARADAAAVVRSAHTLSGASANLGATALARLCATLAADSAVGDLGGSEALLVALEDELARVRSALGSVAPASC